MNRASDWAERIAERDRGAIARAISAIENETADAAAVREALEGRAGHAQVVGVTGPPGVGKSTLVNALLGALLARGRSVAVVAVDPSSPLSGGAVLGDRVRMAEHQQDERVFIRSLAARGHLGGLTRSTRAVIGVLDAARFDVVIVETVGAGQSEVEIAAVAQTKLVVCPPDLGDTVQVIKAGILEIADIFVLNKSDRPEAARAADELRAMLALRRAAAWTPPVVRTVATTGEGVNELIEQIERHHAWPGKSAALAQPMPQRGYPTVVHMLADAARVAPQDEALVCGERRLSYAGYLSCVTGLARELQSLGARGERVASLLGNSIEGCVAAFGVLAAGAQHVPLNPLYSARELDLMLRDAAPRVLIVEAALESRIAPLAMAAGVRHVIAVGPGGRLLDAWCEAGLAPVDFPDPKNLALLLYTGGTTGRPKGVDLAHGAIVTNVAQREGLLPTRAGERILCMMPVSHSYGMAMGLFLAPWCRGALVLLPRYVPEDVLAAVEKERISVFPGSPTVFTGLLAHARFADTDWSSVHTCYSGAAALPERTLQRWCDAVGAPVYEGYGQTEAGPVLSFNPVQGTVKPGSVGVAVPGTEIEIVDVETGDRVLAAGQRGEIRARGPQLMRGYRNLPQETAQALRDGWLYTGDIGEFDAGGYLYIRDRKKDMLIVGGYNVYPRELEEVLVMHPAVLEAAVIGMRDEYRGELPLAYVTLRPGASANAEELLAHCRANLARYKVPARIHIVQALPKTSVAKTDKKALRQRAEGATGGEVRYLRLRADTLMGMFRHLPQPARAQALAALARSTAEAGGDSARRYLEAGGADALLGNIESTANELGWGAWHFAERSATRIALDVTDSPFAAGYGAADTEVCAPITGMLQAVAALVLGAECEAREMECRARGAAHCRFEAVLRSTP